MKTLIVGKEIRRKEHPVRDFFVHAGVITGEFAVVASLFGAILLFMSLGS